MKCCAITCCTILIPQRTFQGATTIAFDATMRVALFRSGRFHLGPGGPVRADGCLSRIGDDAADITASDQAHLTEKGSVFLVAHHR